MKTPGALRRSRALLLQTLLILIATANPLWTSAGATPATPATSAEVDASWLNESLGIEGSYYRKETGTSYAEHFWGFCPPGQICGISHPTLLTQMAASASTPLGQLRTLVLALDSYLQDSYAGAMARATLTDSYTFHGPFSEEGPASVSVGVHLSISGGFSSTLGTEGFGILQAWLHSYEYGCSEEGCGLDWQTIDDTGVRFDPSLSPWLTVNEMLSGTLSVSPGSPFILQADLKVLAGALDRTCESTVSCISDVYADFFSTAVLSFDLPPGTYITSAGGFGQSGGAAVPEPSTLLLLGGGCVGLAGLRRHARAGTGSRGRGRPEQERCG